ncbi:MAG: tetratricopeptide repeat protein [Lewinellaceae bacterium]|nr:tetratricopeptide repeat protein [Lewinellaceae bacterium]
MLKNTALLLIWLLPSLSLLAQPAQSLKAANQAYQEKEYEQAIQLYEEILQEGYHSEAVYYNLGNAYYRKEAFARAILNYQRALKLDPKDKNTLHNLGLAQARLPGQVGKIQQSGVVQAWLSVQNTFSTRLWSILGLAMLWLGGASLAISVLSGIRRRKIRTLAGGVLLLVLSLLPFLLAYGRYQQEFSTTKAVVMVEETQLRAAPEEDSKALQKLYEGVSVEILDAIGAWNKVRLEDTSEGWLPGDVLERV